MFWWTQPQNCIPAFSQTMWLCGLRQTVTACARWAGLQPSVKLSGGESAHPSTRPRPPAGKRWIILSRLGGWEGGFSISGSWGEDGASSGQAGRCGISSCCTRLSCLRRSWAAKSKLWFRLSASVTRCGQRLTKQIKRWSEFSPSSVCLVLENRARNSDILRRSTTAAYSSWKGPVEVVRSLLAVHWEETQNSMVRLHIPSGLGTPQGLPGGARELRTGNVWNILLSLMPPWANLRYAEEN